MNNQIIFNSVPNSEIRKTLYTGKVHVTGGREGFAKSSDGRLELALSSPGSSGKGTNPEQLFASGWSACFIGAMQINSRALGIALPDGLSVDTEVDLVSSQGGFSLGARLSVNLPGLSIDDARSVVEAAHATCPYSKATSGNINVAISVSI